MVDPVAVQNSCLRATEERLSEGIRKAEDLIMSGRGNSRAYVLAREAIEIGFRSGCSAAATRLAEVAGSNSREYSEQLEKALNIAGVRAISAMYAHRPSNGGPFEALVDRMTEGIRLDVAGHIAATLEDLSINLAGGVHVDRTKSRIISIDNTNGNGQFAIDSADVQQSATGSMNRSTDLGEIRSLLAQLRTLAEANDAPVEMVDLLLDAERETQQSQPDVGRLKRVINRLGAFGEKVGASALGGMLGQLLSASASLPV